MKQEQINIQEAIEENRRKWDDYWRNNLQVKPASKYRLVKYLKRLLKSAGGGELAVRLMKKEAEGREKILEAGSGSGDIALRLAEMRKQVYIIDTSFYAVQTCAQKAALQGLTIFPVQASIFHLPFKDHSFYLIYNVGVLDHFPLSKRIESLQEMSRLIPSPGRLVVLTNDTRSIIHPLAYKYALKKGKWLLSEKFAIDSLANELKSINMNLKLREYSRGFISQFDFLRYFLPADPVIQKLFFWCFFLIALPFSPLNLLPGYFRISIIENRQGRLRSRPSATKDEHRYEI